MLRKMIVTMIMVVVVMSTMMMENLLSCALSVNPEPDGIDWDADHGGARHDVTECVRPPDHHQYHHRF